MGVRKWAVGKFKNEKAGAVEGRACSLLGWCCRSGNVRFCLLRRKTNDEAHLVHSPFVFGDNQQQAAEKLR